MISLKKSKKSSTNKIVVIVGATTSGKSAFAVKLAKKIGGEIISADSRQIYKGLNLASGKITKKEMAGVPHHCLDLVSPKTIFTAEHYAKCAQRAMKNILARGKVPIIVGGTGFYIDIALGRMKTAKVPPDWKLRARLEKKPAEELFKILKKLDRKRVKNIDRHNKRRLIRAIEIAKISSSKNRNYVRSPFSNSRELENKEKIIWLGVKIKPEKLREKINKRVNKNFDGMIKEIRKLHKNGVSWRRFETLGLWPKWTAIYAREKVDRGHALQKLKTETWRYSRRQMTWFKKNKNIRWVSSKANLSELS